MNSAAFEELTQILECLESSDVEIRTVTLQEQCPHVDDRITVTLTVGIPVLSEVTLQNKVSAEAENFNLQSQRIDVDLTMTVPIGDRTPETPVRRDRTSGSEEYGPVSSQSNPDSIPAYKNPEAL